MSYNIGGFSIAPIEKEHDLRMLGEHIREHNPAVIAFQEFVIPSDTLSLSLSKILTEYPYRKSALATMVNQDKVG
ncbi:MAG: endonuclease/exonuclease/phosphatase family protein, partial [Bacteroidales bacterium]